MLIRPLSLADKPMLESWIAAEPAHSDNTLEWYQETGTKSVIYADDLGEVLAVKFTPCLRTDVDFSSTASPMRIAKALMYMIPEMGKQAKQQGFKEFVFESLSDKLAAFCERLGFKKSPDWRKAL